MCPCKCLCVCACLPLCKRLCDFRFALLFTIEWLVRYAMLMLRVRCSGEMMMEDRSVNCYSIAHSTYIGLTIVLTAVVSAITLRLSSVRFPRHVTHVISLCGQTTLHVHMFPCFDVHTDLCFLRFENRMYACGHDTS